jgi:hypothetical protein
MGKRWVENEGEILLPLGEGGRLGEGANYLIVRSLELLLGGWKDDIIRVESF